MVLYNMSVAGVRVVEFGTYDENLAIDLFTSTNLPLMFNFKNYA